METKKNVKPRQKATEDDINDEEFEKTKKSLFNSYHSYVQTHAGYIIAVMLGLFAFMSSFDVLLSLGLFPFFSILLAVSAIFLYFLWHMFLRIIYWNSCVSAAATLTLKQITSLFNSYNEDPEHMNPYFDRAPDLAIIQFAIVQRFKERKQWMGWFKRQAMKTAGL